MANPHSDELPAFSFRDPAGAVFRTKSRIFRYISSSAVSTLKEFLSSPITQELIASRKLVSTWTADNDPDLLDLLRSFMRTRGPDRRTQAYLVPFLSP